MNFINIISIVKITPWIEFFYKWPVFRINKRYSEMKPKEKLEYRQWLCKHGMWDGEVVIENLVNNGQLSCD